ncbi:MAG: hypothetical protein ACK4YT_11895, partial [Sphingomonas sp.]
SLKKSRRPAPRRAARSSRIKVSCSLSAMGLSFPTCAILAACFVRHAPEELQSSKKEGAAIGE